MTKTLEMIYTNGMLKPAEPISELRENERVRVTIETAPARHPLADVIGILPDEDAKEMMRIIDEEFGKVDPNDWK